VQTIGCKEHHDLMADIVHQAAAGRLWWYQQPDTSVLPWCDSWVLTFLRVCRKDRILVVQFDEWLKV
jgi:hypothetical protein